MEPFQDSNVKAVFDAYSNDVKAKMMALRQLIFETASRIDGVGPLAETLKWGQPSYLTAQSKTGTTVRIDRIKAAPGHYGIFVHCQTSLLTTYRELYRDELSFDGNRCVTFAVNEELPADAVRHCIGLALTYHRDKKAGK